MRVIDLEIGSDAWLEYRRTHLGASQSSIILGINPWQTLLDLYNEQVNGIKQKGNWAMQRGLDREEEARCWFEDQTGIHVEPVMIGHSLLDWKFATLDGMDTNGKVILEIKWANLKTHELAKQGQVIDYYYSQVQSQIECAAVDFGYFLSCHEKDGSVDFVLLKVMRDGPYMIDLLKKEQDYYYDHLLPKIPPEPSDKDYAQIKSDKRISFDLMCEEYLRINDQIKNLTEIKEDIMDHLKSEIGSSGCSASYSLKKSVVRGGIDYKKFCENMDLHLFDEYKKPDTESWRITKN